MRNTYIDTALSVAIGLVAGVSFTWASPFLGLAAVWLVGAAVGATGTLLFATRIVRDERRVNEALQKELKDLWR